jgi:hypothetical protein
MLDEPCDTGDEPCHGVWKLVESFVRNRVYIRRGTPNAILGGGGQGG